MQSNTIGLGFLFLLIYALIIIYCQNCSRNEAFIYRRKQLLGGDNSWKHYHKFWTSIHLTWLQNAVKITCQSFWIFNQFFFSKFIYKLHKCKIGCADMLKWYVKLGLKEKYWIKLHMLGIMKLNKWNLSQHCASLKNRKQRGMIIKICNFNFLFFFVSLIVILYCSQPYWEYQFDSCLHRLYTMNVLAHLSGTSCLPTMYCVKLEKCLWNNACQFQVWQLSSLSGEASSKQAGPLIIGPWICL